MEKLVKGYCFTQKGGSRFLIVGDVVMKKTGETAYLCQELEGAYRLEVWSREDILSNQAKDPQKARAVLKSFAAQSVAKRAQSADRYEPVDPLEQEEEETQRLQALLLRFLEAPSCAQKLELLEDMKGKATDNMLESMAISLDYELGGGSVEEKYYALERFLKTRGHYEGDRLR